MCRGDAKRALRCLLRSSLCWRMPVTFAVMGRAVTSAGGGISVLWPVQYPVVGVLPAVFSHHLNDRGPVRQP